MVQLFRSGRYALAAFAGSLAFVAFWWGVVNRQQRLAIANKLKDIALRIKDRATLTALTTSYASYTAAVNRNMAATISNAYTKKGLNAVEWENQAGVITSVTAYNAETGALVRNTAVTKSATIMNYIFSKSLWSVLLPLLIMAAIFGLSLIHI